MGYAEGPLTVRAKTQVGLTGQVVRGVTRHVYIVPSESSQVELRCHAQLKLWQDIATNPIKGPQPNCSTGQAVRVMARHVSRWAGG